MNPVSEPAFLDKTKNCPRRYVRKSSYIFMQAAALSDRLPEIQKFAGMYRSVSFFTGQSRSVLPDKASDLPADEIHLKNTSSFIA